MIISDGYEKFINIQNNIIEYLDDLQKRTADTFDKYKSEKYSRKKRAYDRVFDHIERLQNEIKDSKTTIEEKTLTITKNTDTIKNKLHDLKNVLDTKAIEINSMVRTDTLENKLSDLLKSIPKGELPSNAKTVLHKEYGGGRRKKRKTAKKSHKPKHRTIG